MYPRAEATPLWFEPDYEDLVDIDTIDIEDPSPSPEDMYATLEAWSVRRHAMERAYGPARTTPERERAEQLELAAAQQAVVARKEERRNTLVRREAAKRESKAAQQRFVDDRERLVQLAEVRIAQGQRAGDSLPMEHFWAERFIDFTSWARTPGKSKRHAYRAVMSDGSTYAIVAKGSGAARGAVLLDTKTVLPQHQRPPFNFHVDDYYLWSAIGLSKTLASRINDACRERGGCAEVVGMLSRAWLVPIQNERKRSLVCVVAAPTRKQALQAVIDDVDVQDEWKSDRAVMSDGIEALSDDQIGWMRTANEYLRSLLTEEPRVVGILESRAKLFTGGSATLVWSG